jgi:hypothetical protein
MAINSATFSSAAKALTFSGDGFGLSVQRMMKFKFMKLCSTKIGKAKLGLLQF